MEKSKKIIATIVIVIFFIAIFAAITGSRSDAGNSTPGFAGIAVFAALVFGLRAIWKKSDDENE